MDKKIFKFLLLLLILFFLFKEYFFYKPILFLFPKEESVGYIINEKYYKRRGQFTKEFSYYYQFSIRGKKFSNPTYNEKYKVGDTILVEYNKTFPFMNRIKNSSE